jgi:ABC-type transport system substrate-binding protein
VLKKWVSAVAGLASLSALLAAGGLSAAAGASYAPYHSKPTYGGTFRIAFQTDIPELDPLTWTDLQSFYPMHAIYDTLVKYNDNSTQIVPDVAKTWTISKNGLVYTFYLRHNIRFSNGDPLTAQDVAYSIERLTSHANASVSGYGSYYKMIQGFQAWNSGKASTLTGVQVVNPYEIRFTLSYPAAYFLNDLALMAAAIVDPKVVQQWGNQNYSQHAVGYGPFMLKEWCAIRCTGVPSRT